MNKQTQPKQQMSSMQLIESNPLLSWLPMLGVVRDHLTTYLSFGAIFACGLLLLTFGTFQSLRTFSVKLICYLAACLMLALASFLLAFELANTVLCIPLAICLHFFFLCNFTWALVIAVNFYLMIVRRTADCERFEKWYHVIAWLPPSVIVIGTGAAQLYGGIGVRQLVTGDQIFTACYIRSADAVFFALMLPGVIVVTVNSVLFYFVAKEIHDTTASGPAASTVDSNNKKVRRRHFRVYASIFVSVGLPWIVGFAAYFAPKLDDYVASPSTVSPGGVVVGELLSLLFNIAVPLQGLLLFESYCVNAKVAGKWSHLLGTVIPFFKRWEKLGVTKSKSSLRP
jgi:hypothetical protein